MTEEEIKFLLSGENDEVINAHKEIVSMQRDKESLLLFGKDWMDDNIVAGINNKILFFGSRPGGGKTYHCSETVNALLNRELNPTPVKVCRFNLEMPTMTLLLQQISRTLGKTPKEILEKPYSEEEQVKVKNVVKSFRDPRITNISRVLVGEDFRKLVVEFISKIDREDREFNEQSLKDLGENFKPRSTKKVCLIDHLHIYRSKDEIDTLLLICNALKMADKNLSFIIYFQLNRTVEDLWRESKDKKINHRNILPNSTYIYQTDVLQQVADIVVGMVIPQVYDLEEYVAVHKERNQHLKEHFSEDTLDTSFSRTKGRNRIFYNYMKIRLINSFEDPRIFCEILDKSATDKEFTPKASLVDTLPKFDMPVFDRSKNKSLSEAFGEPETQKGSPF